MKNHKNQQKNQNQRRNLAKISQKSLQCRINLTFHSYKDFLKLSLLMIRIKLQIRHKQKQKSTKDDYPKGLHSCNVSIMLEEGELLIPNMDMSQKQKKVRPIKLKYLNKLNNKKTLNMIQKTFARTLQLLCKHKVMINKTQP